MDFRVWGHFTTARYFLVLALHCCSTKWSLCGWAHLSPYRSKFSQTCFTSELSRHFLSHLQEGMFYNFLEGEKVLSSQLGKSFPLLLCKDKTKAGSISGHTVITDRAGGTYRWAEGFIWCVHSRVKSKCFFLSHFYDWFVLNLNGWVAELEPGK